MQQNIGRKSSTAADGVTLEYFIARLAEKIILGENSCSCDMCAVGSCSSQVSGMTCLNGVTAWLKQQAEAFCKDAPEREAVYFTYLDSLSETQRPDAVPLLESHFPHFKMSVSGARAVLGEWRAWKGKDLI